MAHRADVDVRQHARAQRHAARRRIDRLHGVARHIEQSLHDLVAVKLGIGQARIVIALDDELLGRFAAQQMKHVLAQLVNVHQ